MFEDDSIQESSSPATSEWNSLALGKTSSNILVRWAPWLANCAWVIGRPGSGKTVLLRRLIVSALCRGHQVVVIDSYKSDLSVFNHWLSGYAVTLADASALLGDLLDEVRRRGEVMKRLRVHTWTELSRRDQRKNGFSPITLVFNEDGKLSGDQYRGGNTLYPEINQTIESDQNVLRSQLGQLVRGARAFGIYMVVSTQTPHRSAIHSELESNLAARILLINDHDDPTPQALSMIFGPESQAVVELLAAKRSGVLGQAIFSDPSGTDLFQVDFIGQDEAVQILDESGVPEPEKRFGTSDS